MLRKSYIKTAHKKYISQILEAKHSKLSSQLVIAIYAGLLPLQAALHVTRFANENGGMQEKPISSVAPATSL